MNLDSKWPNSSADPRKEGYLSTFPMEARTISAGNFHFACDYGWRDVINFLCNNLGGI